MKFTRQHIRRVAILSMLLAVAFVFAFVRYRSDPLRLTLIHKGMSIQQVEQVLGKPIWIQDPRDPAMPDEELREYRGDGDRSIFVNFKNGIVLFIRDYEPGRNWPPVG